MAKAKRTTSPARAISPRRGDSSLVHRDVKPPNPWLAGDRPERVAAAVRRRQGDPDFNLAHVEVVVHLLTARPPDPDDTMLLGMRVSAAHRNVDDDVAAFQRLVWLAESAVTNGHDDGMSRLRAALQLLAPPWVNEDSDPERQPAPRGRHRTELQLRFFDLVCSLQATGWPERDDQVELGISRMIPAYDEFRLHAVRCDVAFSRLSHDQVAATMLNLQKKRASRGTKATDRYGLVVAAARIASSCAAFGLRSTKGEQSFRDELKKAISARKKRESQESRRG